MISCNSDPFPYVAAHNFPVSVNMMSIIRRNQPMSYIWLSTDGCYLNLIARSDSQTLSQGNPVANTRNLPTQWVATHWVGLGFMLFVSYHEGTVLSTHMGHRNIGIYRVFQKESALLWEMIVWVILSKKVHTNMGPILNGYGVMTAWNLE